jgi:cell division septum initiation protein DivIVA
MWGSRLYSLVNAQGLSQEALNTLAWDAIGGEAGSWVDPLFQGAPPIGDIPGLGSRYVDLVLLGEGATARVYKALDTLLQRQVALKILRDESGTAVVEARAQAQVEHPNVCRIYEVGQGHLVMQLVEGPTLARLAPNLSRDQKVQVIRDVALGVHAAHERGLLHLDLKLNNVFMQLAEDGTHHPVVGDFGMVATQSAEAKGACSLGTPPYTSPEQMAGEASRLDRRADVYAMGVMLYVLLAGVIPFPAQNFKRLLEAMAHEEPVPLRHRDPKIPKDLAAIVHRCLAKDPGARYPSARALAEDLDRFLGQVPVEAAGRRWPYRLVKWAARNRKVTWVAGLALAALLVTGIVTVRHTAFVSEQADWDHHFQKVVEELRSQLDHAYRQPAHDIGPELQQARARLKALEDEVARGASAASGPGHLAAGQARLLLDSDDPQAVVQFQSAWDAGFRTEAARTWLALALLDSFQKAQTSVWRQPDKQASESLRKQVRERYLLPARRMLQGREGAEQIRVAHLLDQVDAQTQEKLDLDRLLLIARNYRARFPDEVDALIEEAQALQWKADHLWEEQSRSSTTWPPPCAAEVEPLREAAARLLLEAHRIAPSHPRVYANLGLQVLGQDRSPTEATPTREILVQRARDWFAQGLAICWDHPPLLRAYSWALGSNFAEFELQHGRNPQPELEALRKLFKRARETGAGRSLVSVQQGILAYAAACGRYGIPAPSPLIEVLDHREQANPSTLEQETLRKFYPFICSQASPFLMEAGLDPSPYLRRGARFEDPRSPIYTWETALRLKLLLAEQARLTGGDADTSLREAEAIFRDRPWKSPWDDWAELSLRLAQAPTSLDASTWTALAGCLGRLERRPQAEDGSTHDPLSLADARLALAAHALDEGRETGPLLQATRLGLQKALGDKDPQPGHVLHERLARLCLLESRAGEPALPRLQEGLREADRALVYTQPLTPEDLHRGRTRRPENDWWHPPHQGRTLQIKGELLLALAEAEPSPQARRRWARQALGAFRSALNWNKNLDHGTATARARAQALAGEA